MKGWYYLHDKFEQLKEEKKQNILNACLKEFALNGYQKASTNQMVKEANISKGLLFHYFINKKTLYLYLYDYVTNIYKKEFDSFINISEYDLIERMKQAVDKKLEITMKYPLLFKFIEKALLEDAKAVKNEIIEKNNELMKYGKQLFGRIDTSKFKDDIEHEKIINIIMWTFKGFEDQVINQAKVTGCIENYGVIMKQLDQYINLFKDLFYKEEK